MTRGERIVWGLGVATAFAAGMGLGHRDDPSIREESGPDPVSTRSNTDAPGGTPAGQAITLVNEGEFHFLVGTQHGKVWSVCDNRATRCELVFSIDGPVSSLHLEGELVHVRSGWIHHVRAWDGSTHDIENTAESYQVKRQKRIGQTYFMPYPA